VFWVFEDPRNFWQKFDAQKCRLKFVVMTKGSNYPLHIRESVTTKAINGHRDDAIRYVRWQLR